MKTFLPPDGPRYSYMIDNVILLITGTLHQRAISELVPKCHPLGSFEQMEAVNIAQTPAELYNAILVDTPLGMLCNCMSVYKEEVIKWGNDHVEHEVAPKKKEMFLLLTVMCFVSSCILPGLYI